jgi:predicted NAD/FAD-dependent oxidoreductase
VLAELFGPRVEDSAIGMPSVPLEDLFAKAATAYLGTHNSNVLTTAPARLSCDADGRVTVTVRERTIRPTHVIAAVPWHGFSWLWGDRVPEPLRGIAARAAATEGVPIVTVNFWYDRPVMPRRLTGFVDGPMHWAFDKSAIFGLASGHVSVVASGASELAAMPREAIVAAATRQLGRALPGAGPAVVRRAIVVREHRATFSLAPDSPPRPPTRTPLAGFYLAGDWTDTGLPGTIEGAVVSGHRAAEAVLADARTLDNG